MKHQISLYGDDAERFDALRDRIADVRPGSTPCNAEMVRILMDDFEENGGANSL